METTTSFPYSIVRFCTMNEVQVKTVIWSSRKNIHSVLSQKKEILDICSIACEKFTGGEKTAKWVDKWMFIFTGYEIIMTLFFFGLFRERQPALAASTILNSLKEKVDLLFFSDFVFHHSTEGHGTLLWGKTSARA